MRKHLFIRFIFLILVTFGGIVPQLTFLEQSAAHAQITGNPKRIFWYTYTPGFPPPAEWKTGDTAASLYKEMNYGNMASRPGSKEFFIRLKRLGFDGIMLNGFGGPYYPGHENPVFPDDLSNFAQKRNYHHYIPWSREAGLAPMLQVMFFNNNVAEKFSWLDDGEWQRIITYIHFVAKTAKSTGCKGLSFEFEPYNSFLKKNPWDIKELRKYPSKRTQTLLAIKRRASQIAEAVYQEFPEAEIHLYGIGVGADTFISRRKPKSASDFIGDDLGDLYAYFLSGFFTKPFRDGIHIDDSSTYGVFDESVIDYCIISSQMKYVDNLTIRWDLKDFIDRHVTIGFALVAHHRWNSKDWWDKVKKVDDKKFKSTLLKLMKVSPYIWLYPGEVDWVYPEIADDLPKTNVMNLDQSPFNSYSQRMKTFTNILRENVNPSFVKP